VLSFWVTVDVWLFVELLSFELVLILVYVLVRSGVDFCVLIVNRI
jgi:hypothetical protein